MIENWINIEGEYISLKDTPQLLRELNLMPLFLRRYFETKYTKDIVPDEEEQINFQRNFLKREGIKDNTALEKWLLANKKTEKEMNNILFNSLKIEKFKNNKFKEHVESLFLKKKSLLDRVTYSLIRVKSRAKAAELHLRLKEEEATFPDLASTFSEGVENVLHGLIGPVEFGNINPIISERLRNSSPGELWPPFEIESWWLILRSERFIPATLNEAMESRLINEMYENWIKEKISNTITSLEKSNLIENKKNI